MFSLYRCAIAKLFILVNYLEAKHTFLCWYTYQMLLCLTTVYKEQLQNLFNWLHGIWLQWIVTNAVGVGYILISRNYKTNPLKITVMETRKYILKRWLVVYSHYIVCNSYILQVLGSLYIHLIIYDYLQNGNRNFTTLNAWGNFPDLW